jgi:hypothetical protein
MIKSYVESGVQRLVCYEWRQIEPFEGVADRRPKNRKQADNETAK